MLHIYCGNGKGKTTLLKIINGDITPDDGHVIQNASTYMMTQISTDDSKSGGEKQSDELARAFNSNADLLILDEPTSGLDPIVRNEILQIFQEFVLEENHTILLSSHITGDLERIADNVTFIDRGRIILTGDKNEILEKHGLLKCKKEELAEINKEDIVSVRQSAFCTEVLVSDKGKCREKYSKMVLEQPSLEEIMIFYVNRAGESR